MREQLELVLERTRLPNVTVQVIPYSAGAHPALDSTFNILDFAGSVPSVVYVEGLSGWNYLERPADLVRYQAVFNELCRLSLSEEKSLELIAKVGKSYRV